MATGTNTTGTRAGSATQRRTWLARGAVIPLIAVVVGVGVRADAAPEQVLQSVAVDLRSDGTITAITSDSVRKASGAETSTDEDSFDPSKVAGDLPVRVLTSYRLGDRVGTDLEEIEGESGRVIVDVTVQNTTVRPELLSYDSAGVRKQQYALVGTPLTVIASAGLGKDDLGQVVTADEAGALTNGVLSRASDGGTQVQWAAMLAPPRLAPSATFRLVQDTEDFQVPDLDVSVQPGLVTDSSVQNLLRSAFAEDAGSTLRMEAETIGLIGEVNTTLTGAAGVLADIQESLAATAGDLGRRAITDLESSTSALSGSLSGVASDISSLQTEISGTLDGTSSKLLGQLDGTLVRVQSLLGDPTRAKAPGKVTQRGCDVQLPGYEAGTQLSVFQHILQVQARLEALKSASAQCGQVIETSLVEDLGVADDRAACTAESTSAICVLDAARNGIGDEAATLAAIKAQLANYDELLRDLPLSALQMAADMRALQIRTNNLAPARANDTDPATTLLDDEIALLGELSVAVTTVRDALNAPGLRQLLADLPGLSDQAATQASAIGALVDTDPLAEGDVRRLGRLAETACPLPAAFDDPADDNLTPAQQLYVDAVRTACGSDLDGEATVTALTEAQTVLTRLATRLDVGVDVEALYTGLDTIADRLDEIDDELAADPTAGVKADLIEVAERARAILNPNGLNCGNDQNPAPQQPMNRVLCAAGLVVLDPDRPSDLETQIDELGASLVETQEDLEKTVGNVDRARTDAVGDVQRLTEALGTRMSDAGTDLLVEGERSISSSNKQLDLQVDVFGTRLDGSVSKVVGNISRTVSSANRSLGDTDKQLSRDLEAVLVDLGDPESGSGGLLGALRTNAGQTALSTRQVTAANTRASSFGNVRAEALDDIYLQQEQLTRSLEMQQEFPAFGLEVPGGSSVLTVFTFHLEGK
ncbi:hypothetical protein [Nocardioides pantholopis]|uniref:hypothetical protein n=1 Tax=Nocardioides pantholopis TaxID=2483798 RepID=UPI0013DDA93C|nr:hypothetical protein [Nocardioides pantholopis]